MHKKKLEDLEGMVTFCKNWWNFSMDVSKNSGNPQIIHFNRVFHYFHHPFWDTSTPIFGNTPMNITGPLGHKSQIEVPRNDDQEAKRHPPSFPSFRFGVAFN